MPSFRNRALGIASIIAAIIGLMLTAFILVQVWRLRQPVGESIGAGLDLFTATLDTTSDTMITLQQSLDTTTANIDSLQQMTDTMANSLHSTGPMVDSLKTLTGKDLPGTIQATEKSLNSAETSARAVDDVLATLTRIPFLPVAPYKPEVPLSTALGEVSDSLGSLTPSLSAINSGLSATSGSLATIESQTRDLSQNIQQIKKNIADIRKAVTAYQETTARIRAQVVEIKTALPGWITMVALGISFVLAWLMITQIDLLIRGLRLLQ